MRRHQVSTDVQPDAFSSGIRDAPVPKVAPAIVSNGFRSWNFARPWYLLPSAHPVNPSRAEHHKALPPNRFDPRAV